MATMTTKRFNKMETFLNWTSKHKQCLIILYLTLIHLIPKRDALQFIFMQNTSNRLHAALEALKTIGIIKYQSVYIISVLPKTDIEL